MANGDTATLPLTPPSGDPTLMGQLPTNQDSNQRLQQFMQLLSKVAPLLNAQRQNAQAVPVQPTAGRPGVQLPQRPPATLEGGPSAVKFDPMSNAGSLPAPIAQPGPSGPTSSPGSAEILAKLDPRSAQIYSGIQGVTQFIQSNLQKKDQSQKAEAANAAQALMSALEGAKTTGDYRPAQQILENNESLFNKVYKGWLQKSEDAKKAKEKASSAKKPDPDVEGFEQGLAQYLGSGAAKQPGQPQPPQTLQGRNGARYMLPQANPAQAIQQQQQSQQMQQQRQSPGQPILTPEERVKMAQYQAEFQKGLVDLQRSQDELKKADLENQKAVTELQTTQAKGAASKQIDQLNVLKAGADLDIKKQQLLNTQAQLRNIQARGALTQKLSNAYKIKFAAVDQAEQILTTMKADKRDFTPSDIRDLQQHLKIAGASSLASSLNKTFNNHWYLPDSFTKPTVDQLFDSVESYKQNLRAIAPALPSGEVDKSDDETEDGDTTPDDSNVITVSPEDMK